MKRILMTVGLAAAMAVAATAIQAQSAVDNDKAFVAKVSQGGMYEVEAGKVAEMRSSTPVIHDLGVLEAHDHEGVGTNLKRICAAAGIATAPALNAEFSARLAKLKAVPAAQFDAYYVADMKQIHTKDEGLFQREAKDGSAGFRDFAHNTAVLVNAHLGWLNTL